MSKYSQDQLSSLCHIETAERWLLIPLATMNLICICTGLYARHLDRPLEEAQRKAEEASRRAMNMSYATLSNLSDKTTKTGPPPTPELKPWSA